MVESTVKTGANASRALVTIKIVHTAVWVFFAGCIVALPVLAWMGRFMPAAILSGVIWVECCVLALNHWRCPMTDLAAKYTDNRSPDFDIYMPVWLAKHNKEVFGTLFVVNELIVLAAWWRSR